MSAYSDVCIIGGGSVGASLAYFLYRAGLKGVPVYYASWESVEAVKKQGGILVVDKPRGLEALVPVEPRHYSAPADRCRFLLNAVKAYDVEESLGLASRIAAPGAVLVMLQNGFGPLELAEERLGGHLTVAGGVVFFGAERVERAKVVYHGGDAVVAGCRRAPCGELSELSRLFRAGGLDFRVVSDVDRYRWLKLALNAVVNPLTALARGRNKVVLSEEGVELASLIISEVCEAARKHGYEFDAERLLDYVLRSVKSVAENTSSMAQDLASGRRTEVEFINGFVARELGRPLSVNRVLELLVKLAERASRT
jgi:2-dehydropantoate 2-reductase